MKYIIYILVVSSLLQASATSNKITNSTKEDMICLITYPSVYETKKENGFNKRVKVLDEENITKIIKPNESIEKRRVGILNCYNQYANITSSSINKIKTTNEYNLKYFLKTHNKYDLRQYENKAKKYIQKKYRSSLNKCAKYKDGEYCSTNQGFDIIYDKNEKIRTILLYNESIASKRGSRKHMLPFKPESIFNLYSDYKPLGLWLKDDYKSLFSKKPTIVTENLIMWENLTKHIKRVIMIPLFARQFISHKKTKNGKYMYEVDFKYTEKPFEYLQSIQIEYR